VRRHCLCRRQAALHGASGAPRPQMECPQRRCADIHRLILWRVTELYGAQWRRRRRRCREECVFWTQRWTSGHTQTRYRSTWTPSVQCLVELPRWCTRADGIARNRGHAAGRRARGRAIWGRTREPHRYFMFSAKRSTRFYSALCSDSRKRGWEKFAADPKDSARWESAQ